MLTEEIASDSLSYEAMDAASTSAVIYVDAKGKAQMPVTCTVLDPANGEVPNPGWYAVTRNVTFSAGLNVYGETNLILCDNCTLTAKDGIWVQEQAKLTIWGQAHTYDANGKCTVCGYETLMYTVTYQVNGGSGAMGVSKMFPGRDLTLPALRLYRPGRQEL